MTELCCARSWFFVAIIWWQDQHGEEWKDCIEGFPFHSSQGCRRMETIVWPQKKRGSCDCVVLKMQPRVSIAEIINERNMHNVGRRRFQIASFVVILVIFPLLPINQMFATVLCRDWTISGATKTENASLRLCRCGIDSDSIDSGRRVKFMIPCRKLASIQLHISSLCRLPLWARHRTFFLGENH